MASSTSSTGADAKEGAGTNKQPTTAHELVAHFKSLPRPENLPSSSGEAVSNHWLYSVHVVNTEEASSGDDEAATPSIYLWIFNPPSQRAHIEHIPVAPPAELLAKTPSDAAGEVDICADENVIRTVAPAVALCLLKAFVEDFGNRSWEPGAANRANAPYQLLVERSQAKLGAAVQDIINKLGVQISQTKDQEFADETDEKMSQAGWLQFRRKVEEAMKK